MPSNKAAQVCMCHNAFAPFESAGAGIMSPSKHSKLANMGGEDNCVGAEDKEDMVARTK